MECDHNSENGCPAVGRQPFIFLIPLLEKVVTRHQNGVIEAVNDILRREPVPNPHQHKQQEIPDV